jgi:hypothetical protein
MMMMMPSDKSKRSATAERNANVVRRLHTNGRLNVANYPAMQAFSKSA